MGVDKSLLSGSTSMLLLSLLKDREMYGYEMIEALERMSENLFSLKAGTLYPLLHGLEEKGLITSEERVHETGRVRRYYRITNMGKRALTQKRTEWNAFTTAVNQILEGGVPIEKRAGA